MKAAFFAILLLVVVVLAKDSPNSIPLVKPDVNFTSTSTTYKVGSFMPSGIITPGAFIDYTVSIDKSDSDHALSVYTQYVGALSTTTNPNDTYASVQIFIRKGEAATLTDFSVFANSTCSYGLNRTCIGSDNTVCDPAKGTWHITVYNSGTTVATYQFAVAVDEYLGLCAVVGWFEEILKDALATLIMVIIGIVVALVGCIASCVYCCCWKNRRHNKHDYHLVNQHHDDHHHHKHSHV
jgi:hypothetical protein